MTFIRETIANLVDFIEHGKDAVAIGGREGGGNERTTVTDFRTSATAHVCWNA